MYGRYRAAMFRAYNDSKEALINRPETLINLEQYITDICCSVLIDHYPEFVADYNVANYLQPFWALYPPDDRGRSPVGDQVPWIEVGEHAIGHKLYRLIAERYPIRDPGLPSGADNRFILSSDVIAEITNGLTSDAMIFLDIKSVGPRDDFEHTVISPYQVSGDGIWAQVEDSLSNSPMRALGGRAEHPFYPAISPIYTFPNGAVAPTIHVFVKPVYQMLSLAGNGEQGQPLRAIRVICVPNGLLLTINPGYLEEYPGLFFPGKDDKRKPPAKVRCRVSFRLLNDIADWRVNDITNRCRE